MAELADGIGFVELAREFAQPGASLGRLWRLRSYWQVRLRWLVPPAILACVAIGRSLGFELHWVPIVGVAVAIAAYNLLLVIAFGGRSAAVRPRAARAKLDRRLALLQVSLDYAAMLVLIHVTGGVASPLVFFFIFHIIFAAILFRAEIALLFAGIATLGVSLIAAAEHFGWLPNYPIFFDGATVSFVGRPGHTLLALAGFAAAAFVTAVTTSGIMYRLRDQVADLADASATVSALNERLSSLYAIMNTIGSERRLEPILSIATSELTPVLDVAGVTVKLLGDDGKSLRYAASHGLPAGLAVDKVVEVAKSPLNRKVLDGETLVLGRVADHSFQLRDELLAAGIRSVMFAPLTVDGRITGILGAYGRELDRFTDADARFFTLAAQLLAIAIENARHRDAVEALMQERTRFMLQVAHNLRAPVGATTSMVEALEGGYVGDLEPRQKEYLHRGAVRLRAMSAMVSELLTLARNQEPGRPMARAPVALGALAADVVSTFAEEARRRGLQLHVGASEDAPEISGDPEMLREMIENLVSNSVKYTPAGGRVDVSLSRGEAGDLTLAVEDTGIGIPGDELPSLFEEFFRARNARDLEEIGTGLGLAIVKQIVERHGGRVQVDTAEGRGTRFVLSLPVA